MQTSTTDEKQINDAKSRDGMKAAQMERAFREVANTVEGRRLLWFLLERSQLYIVPSLDPMEMAFHNGKRSIGLHLMRLFDRLAPASYTLMQKENTEQPKVENNGPRANYNDDDRDEIA